MIKFGKIQSLVNGHIPPYVYNGGEFLPGQTQVYYSGPYWNHLELEAAIDSLVNSMWVVAGARVHEFEAMFAKMFGAKYAVMVNSGSSANLVMMAATKKYYRWEDDSEVIVSPVGFPTSISVLHQNRLKPVFADIEWDTLNFDLNEVYSKVTDRTRAILLSPVLGNPPDMDVLMDICFKNDLKLIVDNCDSLGSKWDGKFLTDYGVVSSNSFYPAHHISTGEGGMVCTDDRQLHRIVSSKAWWGRDCYCVGPVSATKEGACGKRFSKWLRNYDGIVDHKYIFSNMGYNMKPLDLQGAIGVVQLGKFNRIEQNRKKAKFYINEIFTSNISGLRGIDSLPKADVCWFGTPLVCEDAKLKNRLVSHLENNKIQTRNYFAGNILLHGGYSFLGDYREFPEANKVLDRVFFVGASPHYNDDVFDYIEEVVKRF